MSDQRGYITRADENGDVYIAEEVLAMIAGAAAMESEGVTGLVSNHLGEQFLGKKSLARGVFIQREDDELTVTVSVMIQYGCTIPDLATKVQQAVSSALDGTSGLTVNAVHIRVNGITITRAAE